MKKIVFLTATRADFGKLKSLIEISIDSDFEVHIFATGMHMHKLYGGTVDEIVKQGYGNIYKYINQSTEESMDLTLSNTIQGLSGYVNENEPDLIVIHGDRVEALAGAIVGALNNILVAHIEGGEVSGTIDELIRHSVSKLSHVHFVANDLARKRLIQMGEIEESVFTIGSPDVDIMLSKKLLPLGQVKKYYQIEFTTYGIVLFHPVTTDKKNFGKYSSQLVDALVKSKSNFIVIYPNNDMGSSDIRRAYSVLEGNDHFKIFPSVRFEYFLVLLKHAMCIVGNSSAGIREAPYYGVPTINIGSRQDKRSDNKSILNTSYETDSILDAINESDRLIVQKVEHFGNGQSDKKFLEVIETEDFWTTPKQKQFRDLAFPN
ncbi:MAG: UDP-N-acetylglucosamine 2-epimerase [Cyclobacteriaceae bacterium]